MLLASQDFFLSLLLRHLGFILAAPLVSKIIWQASHFLEFRLLVCGIQITILTTMISVFKFHKITHFKWLVQNLAGNRSLVNGIFRFLAGHACVHTVTVSEDQHIHLIKVSQALMHDITSYGAR